MKGIEMIAAERAEQIERHGRTVDLDVKYNKNFQLSTAAAALVIEDEDPFAANDIRFNLITQGCPEGWNEQQWAYLNSKDYLDRLVISGAFVAAEIDRVLAVRGNKK